ncbi:unnamed protein product [Pedinophyceae sp. YPF-701]|nr:unnamed protein product [Pedinophyceae sp. YPF-701]
MKQGGGAIDTALSRLMVSVPSLFETRSSVSFGHSPYGAAAFNPVRPNKAKQGRKTWLTVAAQKLAESTLWKLAIITTAVSCVFADFIAAHASGGAPTALTSSRGSWLTLGAAALLAADGAVTYGVTRELQGFVAGTAYAVDALGSAAPAIMLVYKAVLVDHHAYLHPQIGLEVFQHLQGCFLQRAIVTSLVLQPLALFKILGVFWRRGAIKASQDSTAAQRTSSVFASRIRSMMLTLASLSLFLLGLANWVYAQQSHLVGNREVPTLVGHLGTVAAVTTRKEAASALRAVTEDLRRTPWQVRRHAVVYLELDGHREYLRGDCGAPETCPADASEHHLVVSAGGPRPAAVAFAREPFFLSFARWSAIRKVTLVLTVLAWSFALWYVTDSLVLAPLCALLTDVTHAASQLDEYGFAKSAQSPEEALSLEDALHRVSENVWRAVKKSMRGADVVGRVAREGEDGLTGLGLGEWRELYGSGHRRHGPRRSKHGGGARVSRASGRSSTEGGPGHTVPHLVLTSSNTDVEVVEDPELYADLIGTREWNSLEVPPGLLPKALIIMFARMGLVAPDGAASDMPTEASLQALIELLADQYDEHPYHNWFHAVDVCHSCFQLLLDCERSETIEARTQWTSVEKLCLLVAALSHDLGHVGVTNDFLVQTGHPLAITYNDNSPQENGHCARLFQTMARNAEANVFRNLRAADRVFARETIISLIQATDMKHHFSLTSELETLAEDLARAGSAGNLPEGHRERRLLLRSLLHAADVAYLARAQGCVLEWTSRIVTEFFLQGDKERSAGSQPAAVMDRTKEYVPQGQLGFLDAVIRPYFCALVHVAPWHGWLVDGLRCTYRTWLLVIRQHQAALAGCEDVEATSVARRPAVTPASNGNGAPVSQKRVEVSPIPALARAVAKDFSIHAKEFAETAAYECVAQPLDDDAPDLLALVDQGDAEARRTQEEWSFPEVALPRTPARTPRSSLLPSVSSGPLEGVAAPRESTGDAQNPGQDAVDAVAPWEKSVLRKQALVFLPTSTIPAQVLTMDTNKQYTVMVQRLITTAWRPGAAATPRLPTPRQAAPTA